MNEESKLDEFLKLERFPRAGKYDSKWILENQMGLNPLWLSEWLCHDLQLKSGMRVLDLGCGKGLSSIFLAKEYGVAVWALDLWIKPTPNFERICQAGVADRVYPMYGDARNLPFAEGYFEAVICTDAYIYFGTDDLYLDYIMQFIKPGGQIGITVPGFMRDIDGRVPDHILPFWAQECWTWHTLDWWRRHWERTGLVSEICAEALPEGWKLWMQWKKARAQVEGEKPSLLSDIQVLETDQGKYMGFIRMTACKK